MNGIRTIFVLITLFNAEQAFSQNSISDLWFPSSKKVRKAKENAQAYLLGIQDSLEIKQKNIRVRKFKLDLTPQFYELQEDKDLFEAISFPKATPIYKYRHLTNRRGTGYVTTFEFDYLGNVIFVETNWILVSY